MALCDYALWILGRNSAQVIEELTEYGWTLASHTEVGAMFEMRIKYPGLVPPEFPGYPELVVVMSSNVDGGAGFDHFLHVAQHGHYVNREWEYDEERDAELEAIANDGFDPDNLVSETLYEHGVEQTLRQCEGNREWQSSVYSTYAYMAHVKCKLDDQQYEQSLEMEEEE